MTLAKLASRWSKSIARAAQTYQDHELDLSQYKVELHNASWCPDCEREVSDLLGLQQANTLKFAAIELHSYENKASYQQQKQTNSLPIKCLPTIIFYRADTLVLTVEENSHGGIGASLSALPNNC